MWDRAMCHPFRKGALRGPLEVLRAVRDPPPGVPLGVTLALVSILRLRACCSLKPRSIISLSMSSLCAPRTISAAWSAELALTWN